MRCTICGQVDDPSNFVKEVEDDMRDNQICFNCHFWKKILEEDKKRPPHTCCVIDGSHYVIEPDEPGNCFSGFGGAEFQIEFFDGTKVVTHNLWHQGTPSNEWKDKFPNNARFENNLKWRTIKGCEYLKL